MVFHALTFARSQGRCWKPRPMAEVFNISRGTRQTLMYWKTMSDRCYCIISTKCSVTFAKNVALYFVNVWQVRGRCWKPRPKAEVFNISRGTRQTLMYWKTMFDRCHCIISTKCSVTFAKIVALYFVNVWQSTPECTFILICVCLVREHQSIQDGHHRPIRLWCFRKKVHIKTRWSPTSANSSIKRI